jgi:hypothetical protein
MGVSHSQSSTQSDLARFTQSTAHLASQQEESKSHTQDSQAAESQPATLSAAQQLRLPAVSVGLPFEGGVGVGVGSPAQAQTSEHSSFARVTQAPSHTASQQKASLQTQLSQAGTLQPVPACSAQQSPPPPGVGSPVHTSASSQSGSSQSTMLSASLSKPSAQRPSSVRGQRLACAQALSVQTAIEQPSGLHTAAR